MLPLAFAFSFTFAFSFSFASRFWLRFSFWFSRRRRFNIRSLCFRHGHIRRHARLYETMVVITFNDVVVVGHRQEVVGVAERLEDALGLLSVHAVPCRFVRVVFDHGLLVTVLELDAVDGEDFIFRHGHDVESQELPRVHVERIVDRRWRLYVIHWFRRPWTGAVRCIWLALLRRHAATVGNALRICCVATATIACATLARVVPQML